MGVCAKWVEYGTDFTDNISKYMVPTNHILSSRIKVDVGQNFANHLNALPHVCKSVTKR